jgi:hypothetical protein
MPFFDFLIKRKYTFYYKEKEYDNDKICLGKADRWDQCIWIKCFLAGSAHFCIRLNNPKELIVRLNSNMF